MTATAMAEREQAHLHAGERRVLADDLPVERAVARLGLRDELLDDARLPVRRHEVVRARDEPRVPLRVAPGDGRVPRLVHVLVVIEVVRRDPRERREPVEDAQPRRVEGVQAAALERRRVVVVVAEDARAEAEVERHREQPRDEARLEVGREADGREQDEGPEQGAAIRSVTQHGDDLDEGEGSAGVGDGHHLSVIAGCARSFAAKRPAHVRSVRHDLAIPASPRPRRGRPPGRRARPARRPRRRPAGPEGRPRAPQAVDGVGPRGQGRPALPGVLRAPGPRAVRLAVAPRARPRRARTASSRSAGTSTRSAGSPLPGDDKRWPARRLGRRQARALVVVQGTAPERRAAIAATTR